MSKTRHDAMIIMIAIAVAWLATPWARILWSIVAVPEYFSTTILWLDYAYLSLWAFEFIWAALFGISLTRSLHSQHAVLWSLLFGFGLGLWHFVSSSHRLGPNASLSIYVWAYGQYLVPVFAAVAGSWLAAKYWPKGHRVEPNAA
jgi:hypothetical protein